MTKRPADNQSSPSTTRVRRRARWAGYLLPCLPILLVLAGCGADVTPVAPSVTLPPPTQTQPLINTQPTALPTTPAPAVTPTLAPAATAMQGPTAPAPTATEVASSTAATAPAGATFQNPVLQVDFADPGVLQVGSTYYAFATNASGHNIETAQSTDLVHWTPGSDAMPALPSWAAPGGSFVWAPEAIAVGAGFVLYYTAHDQASGKQCIGVATATKPLGHYKDTSDHPLICQADQGGDIDPSPFRDGDKLYLYWKNDGNCCGITTHLYVQALSPDGLHLVGDKPTGLVENDQLWEGQVVEAPRMLKHDNLYYLFFSANSYATADYSVGYAACQTAIGPCKEAAENPVLKSKMDGPPLVIGPGGETFAQVGNQTWILYHAWNVAGGTRGDSRFLWLDRLDWKNGKPVIEGPTTGPQPAP